MEDDTNLKQQNKTSCPSIISTTLTHDYQQLGSKEMSEYQNLDYQNQYNQFFKSVERTQLKDIIKKLHEHQIVYNQNYLYQKDPEISLEIKSECLSFITLRANVTIGPFSTSFLIKYDFQEDHIKQNHSKKQEQSSAIGKGSFGQVFLSYTRPNSVIKCIKIKSEELRLSKNDENRIIKICQQMQNFQKFRQGADQNEEFRQRKVKYEANQVEFKQWQAHILSFLQGKLLLNIKQVFFLKIASALGIAPKIHKICDSFDFLISSTCFSFQMQICHSNGQRLTGGMVQSLKRKLFLLHSLQIVHRDIKGQNILINSGGEPFYIDFGGCDLLKNKQNTTDKFYSTVLTWGFCHPDLQKAYYSGQACWGNLYFYDMHTLDKLLNSPKNKQSLRMDQYQEQAQQINGNPFQNQLMGVSDELRKAKKYIYAYLLTRNIVYLQSQAKQEQIQDLLQKYLSIASKDKTFMKNISIIYHCSNNWSKAALQKQFDLKGLCIDNLSYMQSLRQQIQNQCTLLVDLKEKTTKLRKLQYFQKLTRVKMADIWSNIEFDSLPLMRLSGQNFRKCSIETVTKALSGGWSPNNNIVDKMSSIIHFINFKTKRYGVKFHQKIQIFKLIAKYLGQPFVQESDSPVEVVRKGIRFLIDYFEKHFKITQSYLATLYLTLLSNCVILQAHKRDDWKRWYDKLLADSSSYNFRLANSMKFISIYYCQYCRPFEKNSLGITDLREIIINKLKKQLSYQKETFAITTIENFLVSLFTLVCKSDSVAQEYDQLCVRLRSFPFLDIVALEQCTKVVISFKMMVCYTGQKKSQFMIIYCQDNSQMQYNDHIFIVLDVELYRNDHKSLRNQLNNIDRIIDCEYISDRLLLLVRLKLSFYNNDAERTSKYLILARSQLASIYNYNNYILLLYLKSIFINKSRKQQMVNKKINPIGQHLDTFIALNLAQIKQFLIKANQIQANHEDFETIIRNFDAINLIFLQFVGDYCENRISKNPRKEFNYEKIFHDIRFFKDFAESSGNEPHGKFSLMFRIEQLSKRPLEGLISITKFFSIQMTVGTEAQKQFIDRQYLYKIKKYQLDMSNNHTLLRTLYCINTRIWTLMIFDKLTCNKPDMGGCMKFMQQYLDLTDFSEHKSNEYLFNVMKDTCIDYFYRQDQNNNDQAQFHKVNQNYYSERRQIQGQYIIEFDYVYAHICLCPQTQNKFVTRVFDDNIVVIIHVINENKKYSVALIKQSKGDLLFLPLYFQYYRLQQVDTNDAQPFQREKRKMKYLIGRYSNDRQIVVNMMKRYIPTFKQNQLDRKLCKQNTTMPKAIENIVLEFIHKNGN